ncbi:MAG: NAD(P)H-dependent oxidoreductase subunit E [Desulfurivibrio sp.]
MNKTKSVSEHRGHKVSDQRWSGVEAAMRRNGYQAGGLIEALHAVQRSYGYIDQAAMRAIAATLTLPLSKVYGVATFYHFFHLKPKGRHTCVVCLGTACYIKGAETTLKEISAEFGIKAEETSRDGRLSLLTARCVGACGQAPAVVVDDRVIGQAETAAVLEYLRNLNGAEGESQP